jgi:rubrerythrin
MATKENLKEAFAGESQANRRYLAYAKKAESEGYPEIAKLFRAAGEAETVHALAHLRVSGEVRSTRENLDEAMKGESYEFKHMYPGFIDQAREEENKGALVSFQNAMAVEQVHFSLFNEASQALAQDKDLPCRNIFICTICGNTVIDSIPDKCPVCGAVKDKFVPQQ